MELKHTTTKSHQITKEDSKRRSKEQRRYKTESNEQNGNSKSLPIINYFKHNWIKFSHQKTRVAKWIKHKIQQYAAYKKLTLVSRIHGLRVKGWKKMF